MSIKMTQSNLNEKVAAGDGPGIDVNTAMTDEISHGKSVDVGAQLFAEVDQYSPEELEAERVHVRKLIDWRIMPIVCPFPDAPRH